MIITKKTDSYPRIIPWLMILMQICELPFLRVLPIWYVVMIAIWLFCSIFFLTVLLFRSLYQAIPILLTLLIGLPARLIGLLESSVDSIPYVFIILYLSLIHI